MKRREDKAFDDDLDPIFVNYWSLINIIFMSQFLEFVDYGFAQL